MPQNRPSMTAPYPPAGADLSALAAAARQAPGEAPEGEPDWGPDPRSDDAARLARLRSYRILDSAAEQAFDRITAWAREHFGVPVALVSLVDMNRQWFKSAAGLEVAETPRDVAFCHHAILRSRPLVVEDASRDPRFRDNPLVVGEPGIRFYAGAPIITSDGFALGTVCLIDRQPRAFPLTDRLVLARLAGLALAEMEARLSVMPDAGNPAS